MAISYINTTEVENISKELISLAEDFNKEINNLFTRFSEVPYLTQEWVGQKSIFYFNCLAQDKQKYINFGNQLKDVGYKLSSGTSEIKSCIKKNINNENKR